ncbi:MAG: 4-(cytidine 5'-diphospho)-2-C-methyl-D-erythritol kinase [Gammaproteobacteria bacterium]|nr:4-(cytidine 5'-diphospho)-2-C-methyl-D-erythritol kinase [Gammaproteobacteria bacterium]MBQ0773481.1 4-(cytidine 5'-diphospho)-2-C-methyl-D-erythritol kinase [Gammaproteobacteria bacterium]
MTQASSFSLPAPAKLNLFLHITGQRDDGYHLLQTVFALLDHGDTLQFQPADSLSLQVSGDAPVGEDNLILRAANALQRYSGCTLGAQLALTKRLPQGGGVGGGSSDAASTLLGLNHLWQLNLSIDELADIGLSLGADIPVFVRGHNAWAEGVGDQLQPINLPEELFLVIHPGISAPTAVIFQDPQLTRDTAKSRVAAFLGQGLKQDTGASPSNDCDSFHNDCEATAKRHFPAIAEALNWLEERAGNARMTGTGACVFARIADRQSGEDFLLQLPPHWTGFVASSVKLSPAHQALKALQSST